MLSVRVVKLGGSLLDQPDIGAKLRTWLTREGKAKTLIVVGGGELVEAMRDLDRLHSFETEAVHWWCVDLLSTTAAVFVSMLGNVPLLRSGSDLDDYLEGQDLLAVVEVSSFYGPQLREAALPSSWDTTTDSIAALLCQQVNACELVLMKSCEVEQDTVEPVKNSHDMETIQHWSISGVVDAAFPAISAQLPRIRCVNLREVSAVSES